MKIKKTRYAEAMRKRQQCLDYIVANPNALSPDISDYMRSLYPKEDRTTTTERLRQMAANGDVSRTKVSRRYINASGKTGITPAYAHMALRTIAKPYEEVWAGKPKKPAQREQVSALDPDRKPIRNQGGQSSGMPRVFVGSMG